MGELWRPVPACRWFGIGAGVFEASTEGHARAHRRALAEVADRDGYLRVKYAGRWFGVHVLVALAFKGQPEVRHLGERTDNKPASLAWGSRWENEQDKKDKEGRSGTVPSQAETPGTADHL